MGKRMIVSGKHTRGTDCGDLKTLVETLNKGE